MTITLITDPKVLVIPIIECHEPLIDVKQYPELSYGPVPESDDVATLNRTSNLNYYEPEECHGQKSKQKLYARI